MAWIIVKSVSDNIYMLYKRKKQILKEAQEFMHKVIFYQML